MRNQGKLRLGYFPLPLAEARRIRATCATRTHRSSRSIHASGTGRHFRKLREKRARAGTGSSWMRIARNKPPRSSMS
jgi:hypothetical protein